MKLLSLPFLSLLLKDLIGQNKYDSIHFEIINKGVVSECNDEYLKIKFKFNSNDTLLFPWDHIAFNPSTFRKSIINLEKYSSKDLKYIFAELGNNEFIIENKNGDIRFYNNPIAGVAVALYDDPFVPVTLIRIPERQYVAGSEEELWDYTRIRYCDLIINGKEEEVRIHYMFKQQYYWNIENKKLNIPCFWITSNWFKIK